MEIQYQVYKNLTNGKLSIRDKKSGLVVGHAESVWLNNVTTTVNETERQRVIRDNRKYVHAFVVGNIWAVKNFTPYKNRHLSFTSTILKADYNNPTELTYNPFKYETFVNRNTLQAADDYYDVAIVTTDNVEVYHK